MFLIGGRAPDCSPMQPQDPAFPPQSRRSPILTLPTGTAFLSFLSITGLTVIVTLFTNSSVSDYGRV